MKLAIALAVLATVPSAAFAGEPCRPKPGLCQPERPYVTFALPSASPKAGHAVDLVAKADGPGVTLAWDLDGDGAYDDATGTAARATFAAGQRTVGLRATDQFGRTATEVRGFYVTTVNVLPTVQIDIGSGRVGTGQPLTIKATGLDIDGAAPRVQLDLDEDGAYETTAQGVATFATPGAHVVRARVTDDDGGVAHATATVGVYTTPGVTVQARVPVYHWSEVVAGQPTEVVASPGGYADYAYDLDGDGTYEARHGESFTTTFAAGDRVIGVRATDVQGRVATSRASVHVSASAAVAETAVQPLHPALAYVGVPVRLSARYVVYVGDPVLEWDADGDGAFDDGSATQRDASMVAGVPVTYTAPGVYPVRVRATTTDGRSPVAMRTIQVVDGPPVPSSFRSLHTWPVVTDFRQSSFELEADQDAALTFDLDGDGEFDDYTGATTNGYPVQFTRSATLGVKATAPDGGVAIRTADVNLIAGNLGPAVELTPFRRDSWDGRPVLFSSDRYDPIYIRREIRQDDIDPCCDFAWDSDGDGAYDDGTDDLYLAEPDPGEREIGLRAVDAGGAVATVRRTFAIASDKPRPSIALLGATLRAAAYDREQSVMVFDWDLDGDGAFDDATGATATPLPGDHLVGVKATDPGGDIGIAYEYVTPRAQGLTIGTPHVPAPLPGPPRFGIVLRPAAVKLASLLARGLAVTVDCAPRCRTASVVATLDQRTAERLRLPRVVGRGAASAARVRVKLTAKARRALKRRSSVRLTLTATATRFPDGACATATKTLTIRR